jgi:hypothetical protein
MLTVKSLMTVLDLKTAYPLVRYSGLSGWHALSDSLDYESR